MYRKANHMRRWHVNLSSVGNSPRPPSIPGAAVGMLLINILFDIKMNGSKCLKRCNSFYLLIAFIRPNH
jgi:hypothetical protein